MANLTFPSNPTNGQKVTLGDKVFVYSNTTSRWTATKLNVFGNLAGNFTIAPPELSLSNNTVAFSTTGETVYITYTVDQDVKASFANNSIANSSYANVTLHQTNNTIQITAGTLGFSGANVVLTVTNTRTSNTASINLSAAYLDEFYTDLEFSLTTSGTNVGTNENFVDNSTNTWTLTPNDGHTTMFHPYLENWSVDFNGNNTTSGGGLDFGNDSSLALGTGDFTIEYWANLSSYAGPPLDWRATQTNGNYPLASYNGSQFTWVVNGTTQITSSAQDTLVWHHVAIVRNSGTTTMYVDGTSEGTWSDSTNYLIGSARVGLNAFGGGLDLDGLLSNVRVVKGTAVYTSAFTPPTENLTAISGTVLLTCQSNRFKDNSSNAWPVTVTNTPAVTARNPFGQTVQSAGSGYGAYETDGSDYIQIQKDNSFIWGTNDVTIEAWVYLKGTQGDTNTTRGMLYGKTKWPSQGSAYWFNEVFGVYGTGACNYGTNNSTGDSGSEYVSSGAGAFNQYEWAHVVFTQETISSTRYWNIYVNGVRKNQITPTRTLAVNESGWQHAIGGNGGDAIGFDVKGFVADFRITNSAVYSGTTYTVPTSPVGVGSSQLYIPMDDYDIVDQTGNVTVELSGGAQTSTGQTKYASSSLYFPAASNYAKISSPRSQDYFFEIGTEDFTFETWLYPTTSGGTIVGHFHWHQGNNRGWQINRRSSDQKISLDASQGIWNNFPNVLTSATVVSQDTWTHIAVCRESGVVSMYFNGTKDSNSVTYTASLNQNNNLTTAYSTLGGRYADGSWAGGHVGYMENPQFLRRGKYTASFTAPTTTQSKGYQTP